MEGAHIEIVKYGNERADGTHQGKTYTHWAVRLCKCKVDHLQVCFAAMVNITELRSVGTLSNLACEIKETIAAFVEYKSSVRFCFHTDVNNHRIPAEKFVSERL